MKTKKQETEKQEKEFDLQLEDVMKIIRQIVILEYSMKGELEIIKILLNRKKHETKN